MRVRPYAHDYQNIAEVVLSTSLLGMQRESIYQISVGNVEVEIYVGLDMFIQPWGMLSSNPKI